MIDFNTLGIVIDILLCNMWWGFPCITVGPQAAGDVSHHRVHPVPPVPVRPRVAFPFLLAVLRVVPLFPAGSRVSRPLRQPVYRVGPPQPLQLPTPVPSALTWQCLLFVRQPRRRHPPSPPPQPIAASFNTHTHAHSRTFSLSCTQYYYNNCEIGKKIDNCA